MGNSTIIWGDNPKARTGTRTAIKGKAARRHRQTPVPLLVTASVERGMARFAFTGGVQDVPAWGDMLKKTNMAGLAGKLCFVRS